MDAPTKLETPLLLLAMPQVHDPFFQKSVVLLLHHQEEGSLGFIVNRPTEVRVSEILDDLEIPWLGGDDAMAFFGGPVELQMGTLVYRSADAPPVGHSEEVFPGVVLTQNVKDLELMAHEPPTSFRLLLGYAGWGDGQLEREIMRNDWLIAPARDDLIFSDNPEDVWQTACESVGVDPDLLPAWTDDDSPTH